MSTMPHQYIDRSTGAVCTEALQGDSLIQFLYSEPLRERAPYLFHLLTSHYRVGNPWPVYPRPKRLRGAGTV
jgi:hypothetical protein